MTTASDDSQFEVRAATENDVDSLVAFHERIFRPSAGVWARCLMSGSRPGTSWRQFLVVEDQTTQRIASSLCMLLQEWTYGGIISMPVSQMELVATDPDFRHRGLMRRQAQRLEQIERAEGCLLSCVQGLPGLYQKFGYEYAIPLKGGVRIPAAIGYALLVAEQPASEISVRHALPADYPRLLPFYLAATRSSLVSSTRSAALWAYQDGQPSDSEHALESYVLERGKQTVGYFRLRRSAKLNAVLLREAQAESWDGWRSALRKAFEAATKSGFNSVLLQLPPTSPLYQAARYAGGEEIPPFAWQVKVLDWVQFLSRIAPVLEARLAASFFAQWTGRLEVRLRDATTLQLSSDRGKLTVCQGAAGEEAGKKCVDATVGMFTQLVFGYRSSEELLGWHPDFRVASASQFALDTLFPKQPSYVYETY